MVAYWDSNQRCVFANNAYWEWFGKKPSQMIDTTLSALLGPLYELNLPYITAALAGKEQVFERRIPMLAGGYRDSIATYTPDIIDGVVRGFWAHVADVTVLREREAALERALKDRDQALAEIKTLEGLLPICLCCKRIKDANGNWQMLEKYVSERSDAKFSHGFCPICFERQLPSQ